MLSPTSISLSVPGLPRMRINCGGSYMPSEARATAIDVRQWPLNTWMCLRPIIQLEPVKGVHAARLIIRQNAVSECG